MRAGLRVNRSYENNHAAQRMLGFRTLVFADLKDEGGSPDHNGVADSGRRWSVQLLGSIRLCLGDGDFTAFIEAVNSVLDATTLEREAIPA